MDWSGGLVSLEQPCQHLRLASLSRLQRRVLPLSLRLAQRQADVEGHLFVLLRRRWQGNHLLPLQHYKTHWNTASLVESKSRLGGSLDVPDSEGIGEAGWGIRVSNVFLLRKEFGGIWILHLPGLVKRADVKTTCRWEQPLMAL